jgi:tRNA G18 (ribose-2'-O)-methylase SpoU
MDNHTVPHSTKKKLMFRQFCPSYKNSAPIKKLALLRQAKWRRDTENEVLVKGRVQITTIAVENPGLKFRSILVSNKLENYDFIEQLRFHQVYKVDPRELYRIAYQSRPIVPGESRESGDELTTSLLARPEVADSLMLATVTRPAESVPSTPRLLLCFDGIVFPQNVGTLIRSAASIGGVDGILASERTCDLYGWKVLEASRGHGFRFPTKRIGSADALVKLVHGNNLLPIVGHAIEGISPSEVDFSNHRGALVVLGNEKHGPSKDLLDMCVRVRIPIKTSSMESLNVSVAGSLLIQSIKQSISNS